MLGEDFETAPKQLLAIVVGELSGKLPHRGVVHAACVKSDVFEVGAADAGDEKICVLWHDGVGQDWQFFGGLWQDDEGALLHRPTDIAFGV
jgi:hypothetical protein